MSSDTHSPIAIPLVVRRMGRDSRIRQPTGAARSLCVNSPADGCDALAG